MYIHHVSIWSIRIRIYTQQISKGREYKEHNIHSSIGIT